MLRDGTWARARPEEASGSLADRARRVQVILSRLQSDVQASVKSKEASTSALRGIQVSPQLS